MNGQIFFDHRAAAVERVGNGVDCVQLVAIRPDPTLGQLAVDGADHAQPHVPFHVGKNVLAAAAGVFRAHYRAGRAGQLIGKLPQSGQQAQRRAAADGHLVVVKAQPYRALLHPTGLRGRFDGQLIGQVVLISRAKSGGGALMDMGIHCIDLLQYISGTKAEAVSCFAGNQTFAYSADDSAALLMKMSNGATAFVDANFNIPDNAAKCRMEFYGTKGSILAEGTISQVESGKIELTTSDDTAGYNAKQDRDEDDSKNVEVVTGNMYEKEITSFANAILNDTEPEITAEDAIFVQNVVEQAYAASEDGVYKKM